MSDSNDNSLIKKHQRLCHIVKRPDFDGYGFNLHSEKGKPGQYIGKVDDDSPAKLAGLKEGDRIIEVNGVDIGAETHKQVVQRIKAIANEVRLLVIDPQKEKEIIQQEIKTVQATAIKTTTSISSPANQTNNNLKNAINNNNNNQTLAQQSINNSNQTTTSSTIIVQSTTTTKTNENSMMKHIDDTDFAQSSSSPTPSTESGIKSSSNDNFIKNNEKHSTHLNITLNNNDKENNQFNGSNNGLMSTNGQLNGNTVPPPPAMISKSSNSTNNSFSTTTTQNSNGLSTNGLTIDIGSGKNMSAAATNTSANSSEDGKKGLNLPMTAAEMRAKLLSKKKYDPKSDSVDLRKKFDIIQKL